MFILVYRTYTFDSVMWFTKTAWNSHEIIKTQTMLSAHKIHIRPCINESFVASIHAMHSLNEREKNVIKLPA